VVLDMREVLNSIDDLFELKTQGDQEELYHESLHFKLIDKKGSVIYTTSEIEQNEYERFDNITEDIYENSIGTGKSFGYFIAPGDDSGDSEEFFSYATSRGYRDFKGFSWIIMMEYETEDIFSPVNELRNDIIVSSLLVAISAIIISLYISRSISKPIINLRNIAKEIEEGNLNASIDVTSNDEIGDLTSSFKKMTSTLLNQQENLEKLVEERTKELENKVDELQQFKKVTVGRELRMVELKKEIANLKEHKNKTGDHL
jgi:methyl-accepting chemotaxis protein